MSTGNIDDVESGLIDICRDIKYTDFENLDKKQLIDKIKRIKGSLECEIHSIRVMRGVE